MHGLSHNERMLNNWRSLKTDCHNFAFHARGMFRSLVKMALGKHMDKILVAATLAAFGTLCLLAMTGCATNEKHSQAMIPYPQIQVIDGKIYCHTVGASMLPTLSEDAWTEIDFKPFDSLVAGDVVVFRSSQGRAPYVCHRLIRKAPLDRGAWFTMGDNNKGIYDSGSVTVANYVFALKMGTSIANAK